ncbi:Nuclear cap-binding protein subunit [Trichinella pseudospiralis]
MQVFMKYFKYECRPTDTKNLHFAYIQETAIGKAYDLQINPRYSTIMQWYKDYKKTCQLTVVPVLVRD